MLLNCLFVKSKVKLKLKKIKQWNIEKIENHDKLIIIYT